MATVLPWGELALFLVVALSESAFAAEALIACLIHEAAHIILCKALGGKFRGISPKGTGLLISYYPASISYGRELIVILSGAAANFLLCGISALAGNIEAATVNFAVGAVNLLPIKGLDGGEALFVITSFLKDENKACKLIGAVSTAFSVILWLCAIYYQLRLGSNLSLLLLSVFILITGLK